MDKSGIFVGVLMFLFGFLFFGITVVLALVKVFKMKKKIKTTGVVMNVETSQGMQQDIGSVRSTLYKPTVRFQTADGRVIDYTPNLSSNTSNYNVGENVPIYYDPQQPQNAFIGTTTFGWVRFAVFAFGGGFFMLFGAVFMLISGFLF